MVLEDQLIEETCGYIEGSSPLRVNTLPGLVARDHVVVEIYYSLFTALSHVTTYLIGRVTLWVEAPHGKLPLCQVWWP